jgi:hypothetical protein
MPDKFPIDLGKKMGEMTPYNPSSPGEKYYPCLYLDWDESYEIPASGVMTVRFVRTRETNTTEKDGKERQSVSLDVTKILSVKADKMADEEPEEDSGKVLDRYKDEVEKDDE